jgi:hypothetical protein
MRLALLYANTQVRPEFTTERLNILATQKPEDGLDLVLCPESLERRPTYS